MKMNCCYQPSATAVISPTYFVVEDYILYKVHNNNNSCLTRMDSVVETDSANNKTTVNIVHSTIDPSELNHCIRIVAEEYQRRYENNFPDFFEEIKNINPTCEHIESTLKRLTQMIFKLPLKPMANSVNAVITNQNRYRNGYDYSHIKWGHIIGLLVIAGVLAQHTAEMKGDQSEEVALIIKWISDFIETHLSNWIRQNGGWNKMLEWGDRNGHLIKANTVSTRSAMSIGVLAACVGLGAMFISRK